jgi:hypothetical protein
MNKHIVKPSLEKILEVLGFESIKDMQTIIPPNSFDSLDDSLVRHLVVEYNLHYVDDVLEKSLTGERKFQIVNRVLELFHKMIIDSIKDVDEMRTVCGQKIYGYRLELMPAGY